MGKGLSREDSMNVFSFIECEPLWVRALREIREAAIQFVEDPKKFLSQIFDSDPFESRRRRYLRAGATFAMFAWIFCGTVYAGWHFYRISNPAAAEGKEIQKIVDLAPLSPEFIRAAESQRRASGGGGGGNHELTPPSRGRLPQASLHPSIVAPSALPPKIEAPSLPVVPTVQVQPELLPQQAMNLPLGDPKGTPGPPSDGTGSGRGIGTGKGGGVGSGDGRGVGPGRGWNTGDGDGSFGGGDSEAVYSSGSVGVRSPQILEKVKPKYTEEARRDKIQGQVVLSAVFRADGTVTEIRILKGLGYGLDEEAMKAAAKIRFVPGLKDGRAVNVRARIEFTFSLL
jgi:TonB family protein